MTVKERKRALSGILYDALLPLPHHLPYKMAADARTTPLTCKACVVVNHPDISIDLGKMFNLR